MSNLPREEALFTQALTLPAAARTAFLQEACSDDPELQERVEALLREHEANAGALDAPLPPLSADLAQALLSRAPVEDLTGTKIGRYKLLQKLGEGGCGVVFMADQEEPVRRRVAIKVIKLGMDTQEVIARFEAERQALALMEHPNIAHVLDAGATDTGRPYFVMELVRGIAITRFCDENRLPTEARLRLFVTVCQAVQHAHQKGVIHRDLKPSNILITLHDGVAVPKIIDFGIAKATGARLTERTLFTQFHAFLGTPAYTSPEQMEMSGLDIDTRSDIYSLGVLLYELLTGQPPFDPDTLVKSGLEAMRRTIREIDPPRPSHRLGTLSAINRSSVALQRGTDPAKLPLLLRGDLDWIAMRCLEKDRARRYDSATSLAADIERHLNDDFVEACPPNRIYRARKFVRRHKFFAAAVGAVTASLVAGLVVSSFLLVRERSAHARAIRAESNETELRHRAEAAAAAEMRQATRTALELASRNLATGRVADGLAYLVHAARRDPENATLAPRLASVLTTRNFILPEGPPFECASRIVAMCFTKDGRFVYVGAEDGTFRVLDSVSGRLVREIALGHSVLIDGWKFPRDDDSVFVVRFTDNTLGVFDTATGQPRWTPRRLAGEVRTFGEESGLAPGIGISPDGRWAYATSLMEFWIWNTSDGALALSSSNAYSQIGGLDFTADGAQVGVTIGGAVERWSLSDSQTSRLPALIPPRRIAASIVKYSPNGRLVAVSNVREGISLFDAANGSLLRTLSPADEPYSSPAFVFATDSRLLGSSNRGPGSWDVKSGEFKPLPLPMGNGLPNSSLDAEGRRILIPGTDGFVRLCEAETGGLVAELAWQQHRAYCAALSPDGMHVVIGTATGAVLRFRVGHGPAKPLVLKQRVSFGAPAPFLPDGPARLLLIRERDARVLSVATGRETAGGFTFPESLLKDAQASSVRGPAFVRSDAKFIVVPTPRGWQAWGIEPGRGIQVVKLEDAPIALGYASFFPDSDRVQLTFNFKHETGTWNLRTGARVAPMLSFPNYIWAALSHSPDGRRIVFGTTDGTAMIIDVETARPLATIESRPLVPNQATFSPDGTRVVTVNTRNEARIWDAATGQPMSPILHAPDSRALARLRYSPDGRFFATWGADSTILRDGRTGAPVGEAISAGGPVVKFSRDSRTLGTAGKDGAVQVWEAATGQPVTEPMRHGRAAALLSEFSPDGCFLSTKTEQEHHIWSVPPWMPAGQPVPDWLLRLATVCASKSVTEAGQLVDRIDAAAQFEELRRHIVALPADAPFAEWGRWIIDERANRPIAPGFTIDSMTAEKLAAAFAAEP